MVSKQSDLPDLSGPLSTSTSPAKIKEANHYLGSSSSAQAYEIKNAIIYSKGALVNNTKISTNKNFPLYGNHWWVSQDIQVQCWDFTCKLVFSEGSNCPVWKKAAVFYKLRNKTGEQSVYNAIHNVIATPHTRNISASHLTVILT